MKRMLRTAFILLLLSADVLLLAAVWRVHTQVQRAVPVVAELQAIDRRSSGSSPRTGGGRITARYTYVVDGRRYEGGRIAFASEVVGGAASSSLDLQQHADALAMRREANRLAALHQGSPPVPVTTTVWVDPAQPSESALMRRMHPVVEVAGWAGLALLLAGIGGLAQDWRAHRRATQGAVRRAPRHSAGAPR